MKTFSIVLFGLGISCCLAASEKDAFNYYSKLENKSWQELNKDYKNFGYQNLICRRIREAMMNAIIPGIRYKAEYIRRNCRLKYLSDSVPEVDVLKCVATDRHNILLPAMVGTFYFIQSNKKNCVWEVDLDDLAQTVQFKGEVCCTEESFYNRNRKDEIKYIEGSSIRR